MKKQIIFIHGGDSYNTYEEYFENLKKKEVTLEYFLRERKWGQNLQEDLVENYQVLSPNMPNKNNARYEEWAILFEKIIALVDDSIILIGHSLGAMFLVKYLAENTIPKRIAGLFLVAGPHNNTADIGRWRIPDSLENIETQCKNIHLFHSEDDPTVPVSELEIFEKAIPSAKIHLFKDRGHFVQPHFPELIEIVKNI